MARTKKDEEAPTATYRSADEELVHNIIETLRGIKGVGEVAAQKLYDGGYYTIEDVAASSPGEVMDKTGMSKSSAETVVKNALSAAKMDSPLDYADIPDPSKQSKLSTGSKAVDELLGGGYMRGIITEIHAMQGVGKTQSAMTASVIATQPIEAGGLDSHVLYVDTEGAFTPARLMQIAEARGISADTIKERFHILAPRSSAAMVLSLEQINDWDKQWGGNLKLIVVDSIIARFRAEYIGRGTLADRQAMLGKYLSGLLTFARTHNAVILITNQMQANPDAMFGPTMKPTGGNVLGHDCQCRIYLRNGMKKTKIAQLTKSSYMPDGEAPCTVTVKGLCD